MTKRPPEEERIAEALRHMIRVSGRSVSAVSRDAGYAPEYLGRVLRGNQDLKIAHVLAVLEVIHVPPQEFWDALAAGRVRTDVSRVDPDLERALAKIERMGELLEERGIAAPGELEGPGRKRSNGG